MDQGIVTVSPWLTNKCRVTHRDGTAPTRAPFPSGSHAGTIIATNAISAAMATSAPMTKAMTKISVPRPLLIDAPSFREDEYMDN